MRILHLVSFDRWSGAVGPALMEVEALRSRGHEAFLAYVGGYKLERKLQGLDYALAIIRRGHGPTATLQSVWALRKAARERHVDAMHAHLSWDHQLALFARPRGVKLVRTYHASRSVRRYLLGSTDAVAVVNGSIEDHPLLVAKRPRVTPPPVDHRVFRPEGPRISPGRKPLLGVIGKLAKGRRFEEAIAVAASIPEATLMIIGDGPHRPALERLAAQLGAAERIIFAGYHEDDLPEHYRAMDVLLFTRQGSDEGHRAVSEAMACGVIPAAYPVPGIETVVGGLLHPEVVASTPDPEALRSVVIRLLPRVESLRAICTVQSQNFSFGASAERLEELYASG
jgi:glycosyltransferase involved in cell wall biosynthesis